ncbi:hypothetical protein AB1A87_14190, partial [Stenotrophomonas maltophilia]|uniref:hypothetical protein n=1 Tax=Stenotrophomonas maltophilia TaxID=40324 RepID=UPI0034523B96
PPGAAIAERARSEIYRALNNLPLHAELLQEPHIVLEERAHELGQRALQVDKLRNLAEPQACLQLDKRPDLQLPVPKLQ